MEGRNVDDASRREAGAWGGEEVGVRIVERGYAGETVEGVGEDIGWEGWVAGCEVGYVGLVERVKEGWVGGGRGGERKSEEKAERGAAGDRGGREEGEGCDGVWGGEVVGRSGE